MKVKILITAFLLNFNYSYASSKTADYSIGKCIIAYALREVNNNSKQKAFGFNFKRAFKIDNDLILLPEIVEIKKKGMLIYSDKDKNIKIDNDITILDVKFIQHSWQNANSNEPKVVLHFNISGAFESWLFTLKRQSDSTWKVESVRPDAIS